MQLCTCGSMFCELCYGRAMWQDNSGVIIPNKEPLKPQDLMRECADLVDQREKTHGDFRSNMRDYAAELVQELGLGVLPSTAAMVLARNKLSRMNVGDRKVLDHYLDAANYIIFAGILATEGE